MDDFDMKTLVEGVKIGVALSKTPAFQAYGSKLIDFPDCAHITKYTDEYFECMIRLYTATVYHPVGKYLNISYFFIGMLKNLIENCY